MEQEMIYHDVLEGGVEEGRMEAANTWHDLQINTTSKKLSMAVIVWKEKRG